MVDIDFRPLSALALDANLSTQPETAEVHLWELPKRRMLTLRLDPSNADLVSKAEAALGMALPTKPNTLTTDGNDGFVLWTSPDEFMIDLPFHKAEGPDAALMKTLHDALAGAFALVVDVSDQMAGIGLGGAQWREVWSKICAQDVHESIFKPGQCKQTVAAKSNILFYAPDVASDQIDSLRIYTRRSFSLYLFSRMRDAAWEYGLSLRPL